MRVHLRTLIKAPTFTLMAIVPLALGFGISTAFFTIVDNVLLEPLLLRDAGRIMALRMARTAKGTSIRSAIGLFCLCVVVVSICSRLNRRHTLSVQSRFISS
jgi:hypothetical protein